MKEFRLTQAQFGARGLMPAIDAVHLAHHTSVQAFYRKKFQLAAFLDMAKAYGRVVPQILIQTGLHHNTPNSVINSVAGLSPLFHLRHARAETSTSRTCRHRRSWAPIPSPESPTSGSVLKIDGTDDFR